MSSLPKVSFSSRIWLTQSGASLVEFVVVAPTLLMMILSVIQSGMLFHAKSNINYATFEAARAGSVGHGQVSVIRDAFTRAMVGYYGGGRNLAEIAQATARAQADITAATMQVELLSPTKESFDDYASPQLAAKLNVDTRVIPNSNLNALQCPYDKPSCNHNPQTNASGQTLSDANILRIKITYGIPPVKQIPLAGRLYVMALRGLSDLGLAADTDAFKQALLEQSRIPIVVHTTMRMQSHPFENGNVSNPGPGNNGVPTPPGDEEEENPPTDDGTCPASDPNCQENDDGTTEPACDPQTDISCGPAPDPCAPDTTQEDIPADVLFDFNASTLTTQGKAVLDNIIQNINAHKNDSYRRDALYITGHTDKIGSVTENQTLSEQRANAVYEYILQGLDQDVDIDLVTKGAEKATLSPPMAPALKKTPKQILAIAHQTVVSLFTHAYQHFNE